MDVTADKIIYGNIHTVDKDRPKASLSPKQKVYIKEESGKTSTGTNSYLYIIGGNPRR